MILDENQRPMVSVYVCWNDHEADIVISVLREQGIEAQANSEVPHAVLPVTADGLGQVDVLVVEDLAGAARRIIQEYREEAASEDGAH